MSAKSQRVLPGFGLALGYTLVYLSLLILLPLGGMILKASELGFGQIIDIALGERSLAAFRVTFGASLLAAAVNAVFGLISAWVLVRYQFPGKRFVDALVDLPFALPTAVAGITLATLYAGNGWLGKYLEPLGIKVAYTPLGIVVALTFITLPFVVRTLQPVIEDIETEVGRIRAHPTVVAFYESLERTSAPAPVNTLITSEPTSPTSTPAMNAVWTAVIDKWRHSDAGRKCQSMLDSSTATIYPPKEQRFAALEYVAPADVKVVILGQDPYHGANQAHGLSFSVRSGIALPPSLKNIRKELLSDLAVDESAWSTSNGDLTPWAQQGVLLLNAVLSVEASKANSHSGQGWEELTSALLQIVADSHETSPLIFLAWGRYAQNVIAKLRLKPHHKVIQSAHPSPLSAHNGFFGSKPFSAVNAALAEGGASPITWTLGSTA